jgi:hypothetical protein
VNSGTASGINVQQDGNSTGVAAGIAIGGNTANRLLDVRRTNALASSLNTVFVYSNAAETAGQSHMRVWLANASSTIPALEVINAGTGAAIAATGNIILTGAHLKIDNNQSIQAKDSGGTYQDIFYIDGSNNYVSRNPAASGSAYYGTANASNSSSVYLQTAGNNTVALSAGKVFLGGGTTPSASADVAASTTSTASLRIRSGTAPTSPNDGDIWYDGTNLKMRTAGATKTFTLT